MMLDDEEYIGKESSDDEDDLKLHLSIDSDDELKDNSNEHFGKVHIRREVFMYLANITLIQ